jgi:hypothetical protein
VHVATFGDAALALVQEAVALLGALTLGEVA